MNFLSILDLLSKSPSLKINNNNKFHTTFGLILSLITISTILSYAIYYMYGLIAKKKYQILERVDNTIIPNFEIFDNKIAFTITNSQGIEYKNPERLFEINAELIHYQFQPDKAFSNFTNIPLRNCSIYNQPPFQKNFEDLSKVWPTSKCLDFFDIRKDYLETEKNLKG